MSGEFLYSGPKNGPVLVLAHGADAAADSAFMQAVAKGVVAHGIRVVRFNFEYMQRALRTARRQPPSSGSSAGAGISRCHSAVAGRGE